MLPNVGRRGDGCSRLQLLLGATALPQPGEVAHRTNCLVDLLGAGQPEEQHGFRAYKRIEEDLLATIFALDKTLPLDVPVWIVS